MYHKNPDLPVLANFGNRQGKRTRKQGSFFPSEPLNYLGKKGERKKTLKKARNSLSDPTEIPPYRETGVAAPLSHCVFCGIADYRCYTPTSCHENALSQSKDRLWRGVSQNSSLPNDNKISDNKIRKISKFYCRGISREKNSVSGQFSEKFSPP